ncbi:MAG: hypothetical protein ACJ8GJ_00025 [Vitreoscilla sp.]
MSPIESAGFEQFDGIGLVFDLHPLRAKDEPRYIAGQRFCFAPGAVIEPDQARTNDATVLTA